MTVHSCVGMDLALDWSCSEHASPFECPDALVVHNTHRNEYGIVVHDGGSSVVIIGFCPWCGADLRSADRRSPTGHAV